MYAPTCRYDTGPILAQAVVPVLPTDTPVQLAARVLKEVMLLQSDQMRSCAFSSHDDAYTYQIAL